MCHSSPRDVLEVSNSSTCRRWESEISRALDFPDAKFVASPARRSGAPTPRTSERRCREQLQDAYCTCMLSLPCSLQSDRRAGEYFELLFKGCFSVRCSSLPRLSRGLPRRSCFFGLEGLPEDFSSCPLSSRFHHYMSWLVSLDNLTADTLQTNCICSCIAEPGVLEACSRCVSEVAS